MSRFLALMLSALLGSASAHTNAVAFVRVVNTPSGASGSNTIDLTFIYGTYHTFSPPEGALALYGYDGVGTETSASSYNTLLYGQGGSQSDATYPLGVLSNLGVIDWSLTSRLADQPWTRATLEEVGFAVGTNYLHDETSNVAIHSHQQATITIPCAATGTTMRYRPDFDSNPVGQVPRSDLSFNYAPCTVATTYPNCGNFDMTDLLIEVDSSCGVSVVGVQGIGPKSPPPPPSPPCGLNGTLCESSATAPAPQTVTVTIKGEEGEDLVQTVAVYTGNTAVPQPPKTRSACCRRDQIGGDLCPWELECSCCAPDNPWTLEKHPTPFWDPLSGQFQADSSQRCEGDNRLGTCPCCLHPDHPDAGLEHRCPKEWRCHPPPPAAMAPAVPVGIALGVAALTAYIFFKPMTMRLQGTVLDDCGNPVVGATVCFEDGQAKFKKFKGEDTTDFRGKYTIKARPGAKGGLSVSMAGYIDDGGGSKNVEMPDKKSKKVAPEDQGNLSLVAPRVLSGLVLSNNGVSKVPLQGAKIEVKQPRIQSDSPPRSPNRMPKRAPSYHMPKSPPPSPPSGHSRIVPDDIDEIPVKTRVAFDEDEVTSSPAARSPTKMARSPSGRTVLRSPSKMLKQGTFRRSRRSSITAETVLKTIQTEDVDTAGKPNYKLELFKGSYNITFSAPGHASQDQSVNLGEKGQPAASTLNVTLVPRVYKLSGAVMTSAALSTQPPSAAGATQAASRAIPGEAKPGAIQSDKDVKVAEYMFQLADTSGDGLVDEEELLVLSVKLMKKKGQVADETDLRTFVTTQRPHPETPAEFDFDAFVGVYNALVAHMAGEEPLPSSAAGSAESEPPVDVTPTPRSAPQGCTPLEGAKLLILDDNGEEIKTLMSGKGGAFDVSLPAGNYTRRVILDGYTTKFDKIEIADDLVSDVHLEVVLYDLIGSISSQNNASYVDGAPVKPLVGAKVTLRDLSGEVVSTAHANARGEYSITATPGTYTREITANGHEPLEDKVKLVSDDQKLDATLDVKLCQLTGTVVDDEDSTPIPSATVELMGDDHKLITSALAGQDGTYTFKLPHASASVCDVNQPKVQLSDLFESSAARGSKVRMLSKVMTRKQERQWRRRVSVAGFVSDEAAHIMKHDVSETIRLTKAQHVVTGVLHGLDGVPLAGAYIELHDASGAIVASAITDEKGAYTMAAGHGEFTWSAEADGYKPMSKKLSIDADTTSDGALKAVSHNVKVLVTGGDASQKLGGVAVEMVPEPKDDDPPLPVPPKCASCVTHPDGSYVFDVILPGRYALTFSIDDYEPGRLEIVVDAANVEAQINLAVKTYKVQGKITDDETGEPIPYASVEMLDKKSKNVTCQQTAEEDGLYTFSGMLPGEHKIKVTAGGFVMKKHTFMSAKEDLLAGGIADVVLHPLHFSLSGCVTSDSDKACPPIPGAVCWLKKNGKIKQRVICDDTGKFSFGDLPGGLYNVVSAAPDHMKMRAVVTLDKDIKPGGPADLLLPKPLPPESDIGAAIAELITPLKSIFQHYCSAAIVGEDNPFQMAFFQVEAFMSDLKLPDGLSKTACPKVLQLFDDVNGVSKGAFRIDQKGEVTGALRPDPTKDPDRILTFDEFLDLQVRLAWICGQSGLLSARSFPSTRLGLGYALKLYVEEILMKRAQMVEIDSVFEEAFKKFKMPQAITKSVTKTFEEISSGVKFISVDQWIKIIKKWRAVGHSMSIIKCRMLYVQFADDDRGKVPLYVQDIVPDAVAKVANFTVEFEEEEDDDVMEARLAAAEAAKAAEREANGSEEDTPEKKERDALASLEDVRKPRATDQKMTLTEMKAAVCRLAYILCKGKTLADRLEAFASMHIK